MHGSCPAKIQWIAELGGGAQRRDNRRKAGCVDVRIGDNPHVFRPDQDMDCHGAERKINDGKKESDNDKAPLFAFGVSLLEALDAIIPITMNRGTVEVVEQRGCNGHEDQEKNH